MFCRSTDRQDLTFRMSINLCDRLIVYMNMAHAAVARVRPAAAAAHAVNLLATFWA
jgi:hypothetical protein